MAVKYSVKTEQHYEWEIKENGYEEVLKTVYGEVQATGLHPAFAAYERDIVFGSLQCPFKVEFRDAKGRVVRRSPVPLKPDGTPRINIF